MRIISGKYRRRRIQAPKNLPARPTTDQAREGLFNILGHRYAIEDARVLDGFAGTGAVSFEFLSRGAASITAVDKHGASLAFIKKTFKEWGESDSRVIRKDMKRFLQSCEDSFDFIFMDPPYAMDGLEDLIKLCFEGDLLAENGVLILEHATQYRFDQLPQYEESRSYGGSSFSFFS